MVVVKWSTCCLLLRRSEFESRWSLQFISVKIVLKNIENNQKKAGVRPLEKSKAYFNLTDSFWVHPFNWQPLKSFPMSSLTISAKRLPKKFQLYFFSPINLSNWYSSKILFLSKQKAPVFAKLTKYQICKSPKSLCWD